jgi:hypothetical protein
MRLVSDRKGAPCSTPSDNLTLTSRNGEENMTFAIIMPAAVTKCKVSFFGSTSKPLFQRIAHLPGQQYSRTMVLADNMAVITLKMTPMSLYLSFQSCRVSPVWSTRAAIIFCHAMLSQSPVSLSIYRVALMSLVDERRHRYDIWYCRSGFKIRFSRKLAASSSPQRIPYRTLHQDD